MNIGMLFLFVGALIALIWMIVHKSMRGSSCCGERDAPEKKVKVSDKNKKNYEYRYTASIEGMVCSNCARHVENAFNSMGDVYAKVNLGKKEAEIYSKFALSRENISACLRGSSYTLIDFK